MPPGCFVQPAQVGGCPALEASDKIRKGQRFMNCFHFAKPWTKESRSEKQAVVGEQVMLVEYSSNVDLDYPGPGAEDIGCLRYEWCRSEWVAAHSEPRRSQLLCTLLSAYPGKQLHLSGGSRNIVPGSSKGAQPRGTCQGEGTVKAPHFCCRSR